ncbi:K+ transporter [Histoplasma capsulatum G186AR]|uniref:K+ transporter n=1 Tax=Ajellomyces capsulatus TaxID=5037 RepID=A0A8H8D561_AJECA|nr:K+ transporter [Histoplasma capsulatum]QSS67203.1 K+ transporter [Histoplasma capsulatum G186AR]
MVICQSMAMTTTSTQAQDIRTSTASTARTATATGKASAIMRMKTPSIGGRASGSTGTTMAWGLESPMSSSMEDTEATICLIMGKRSSLAGRQSGWRINPSGLFTETLAPTRSMFSPRRLRHPRPVKT